MFIALWLKTFTILINIHFIQNFKSFIARIRNSFSIGSCSLYMKYIMIGYNWNWLSCVACGRQHTAHICPIFYWMCTNIGSELKKRWNYFFCIIIAQRGQLATIVWPEIRTYIERCAETTRKWNKNWKNESLYTCGSKKKPCIALLE